MLAELPPDLDVNPDLQSRLQDCNGSKIGLPWQCHGAEEVLVVCVRVVIVVPLDKDAPGLSNGLVEDPDGLVKSHLSLIPTMVGSANRTARNAQVVKETWQSWQSSFPENKLALGHQVLELTLDS